MPECVLVECYKVPGRDVVVCFLGEGEGELLRVTAQAAPLKPWGELDEETRRQLEELARGVTL